MNQGGWGRRKKKTLGDELTEKSSGRPFCTSTALLLTCMLALVTNWITDELSFGFTEGEAALQSQPPQAAYGYFPSVGVLRTLLRTSVLRRTLTSTLNTSSFSCGPRLQEMVMQALPGRSQSFEKRQEEACGKEKCDKQMLRGLRKQGSSQGGRLSATPGRSEVETGAVYLPRLCGPTW